MHDFLWHISSKLLRKRPAAGGQKSEEEVVCRDAPDLYTYINFPTSCCGFGSFVSVVAITLDPALFHKLLALMQKIMWKGFHM